MLRQEILDQCAVGLVVGNALARVDLVGGKTGQHEVEGSEQLQRAGQQYALLSFGQARCTESALDDLLVRAPIEKIQQRDAGEKGGERNLGALRSHRVHAFGLACLERFPSGPDALVIAQGIERVVADEQPSDQQTHPVDRIQHGKRAQSAESRIEHTHDTDEHHRACQQSGVFLDAGQSLEVDHADQADGSRVKDERDEQKRVGQEENCVGDALRRAVEALFQKLRHRGDPGAQETWQEKERHDDQGNDSHHLPSHHAEAVGIGRAIEADHLFGREIRQQQRTGDDRESQRAPPEEKALGTLGLVLAGQKPSQAPGQGGEK